MPDEGRGDAEGEERVRDPDGHERAARARGLRDRRAARRDRARPATRISTRTTCSASSRRSRRRAGSSSAPTPSRIGSAPRCVRLGHAFARTLCSPASARPIARRRSRARPVSRRTSPCCGFRGRAPRRRAGRRPARDGTCTSASACSRHCTALGKVLLACGPSRDARSATTARSSRTAGCGRVTEPRP